MFKKNKTNKTPIIESSTLQSSLSILSESASIKGEINTEDNLRIDGNVNGDIQSGGKIIIGVEGCVKGKIIGKSLEVNGTIYGDVIISDLVILRASSYYEGQITARNIEIEAGASFFGNCKMENEIKEKISGNGITLSNNSDEDTLSDKVIDKEEVNKII